MNYYYNNVTKTKIEVTMKGEEISGLIRATMEADNTSPDEAVTEKRNLEYEVPDK